MDQRSQVKVTAKGFSIVRKEDWPSPRIKWKGGRSKEWRTLEKYATKAERDRAFEELMKDPMTISD